LSPSPKSCILAARRRLNISQPPLSQQIQILEQQVGARLLARTNRSVSLTAAGKQFLIDSRQILSMVDDAAARAERLYLGKPESCASGLPRPHRLSAPSRKRCRHSVAISRMFIFRRARSTPASRSRR
jgi:DNA-binding transcriptional LysR family regulator